jgi:hypothetical protein
VAALSSAGRLRLRLSAIPPQRVLRGNLLLDLEEVRRRFRRRSAFSGFPRSSNETEDADPTPAATAASGSAASPIVDSAAGSSCVAVTAASPTLMPTPRRAFEVRRVLPVSGLPHAGKRRSLRPFDIGELLRDLTPEQINAAAPVIELLTEALSLLLFGNCGFAPAIGKVHGNGNHQYVEDMNDDGLVMDR